MGLLTCHAIAFYRKDVNRCPKISRGDSEFFEILYNCSFVLVYSHLILPIILNPVHPIKIYLAFVSA